MKVLLLSLFLPISAWTAEVCSFEVTKGSIAHLKSYNGLDVHKDPSLESCRKECWQSVNDLQKKDALESLGPYVCSKGSVQLFAVEDVCATYRPSSHAAILAVGPSSPPKNPHAGGIQSVVTFRYVNGKWETANIQKTPDSCFIKSLWGKKLLVQAGGRSLKTITLSELDEVKSHYPAVNFVASHYLLRGSFEGDFNGDGKPEKVIIDGNSLHGSVELHSVDGKHLAERAWGDFAGP